MRKVFLFFGFIIFLFLIGFSAAMTQGELEVFLKGELEAYFENEATVLDISELKELSDFYFGLSGEDDDEVDFSGVSSGLSEVLTGELAADVLGSDILDVDFVLTSFSKAKCLDLGYLWCFSGTGIGSHVEDGLLDYGNYECRSGCSTDYTTEEKSCLSAGYSWCFSGTGIGSHVEDGLLDYGNYECWSECSTDSMTNRELCEVLGYSWCFSGTGIGSGDHLQNYINLDFDQDGYECWSECFYDSISDTEAIVIEAYNEILDRDPVLEGFDYWVSAMDGGFSEADLAKSFFWDIEYRDKGYTTEETVEKLYDFILDRDSDSSGKDYWVSRLNDGFSLDDAIDAFYSSDEYVGLDDEFSGGCSSCGDGIFDLCSEDECLALGDCVYDEYFLVGGSCSDYEGGYDDCEPDEWLPSTGSVCSGIAFRQTSNCNTTRTVMGIKDCDDSGSYDDCEPDEWLPSTDSVCSGTIFTQTSNCDTTRTVTGTKSCDVLYLASVDGEYLDCNYESDVASWYTEKGRCGTSSGLIYWEDTLSYYGDYDYVKEMFDSAYEEDCLVNVGDVSNQDCNNERLCSKGGVYEANTAHCIKSY